MNTKVFIIFDLATKFESIEDQMQGKIDKYIDRCDYEIFDVTLDHFWQVKNETAYYTVVMHYRT